MGKKFHIKLKFNIIMKQSFFFLINFMFEYQENLVKNALIYLVVEFQQIYVHFTIKILQVFSKIYKFNLLYYSKFS